MYTGITTDIKRRFEEHASGKGAKYFRTDHPVKVVYSKQCKNRSEASKIEALIKKMSHDEKASL